MTGASTLKVHSEATQLSDEDLRKGVEILKSLQTVHRALRLQEAGNEQAIPMIVDNVFRNDMFHAEFTSYLRKRVGYEEPDQRELVTSLLLVCFEEVPAHSFAG